MTLLEYISQTSKFSEKSISNTIQLLQEGATIPFVARYRKEMTGNLDELEIAEIRDNLKKYEECQVRQKAICKASRVCV